MAPPAPAGAAEGGGAGEECPGAAEECIAACLGDERWRRMALCWELRGEASDRRQER